MSCMAPKHNAKAVRRHVENNCCCEQQKVKAEPSNQILSLRDQQCKGLEKTGSTKRVVVSTEPTPGLLN